MSSDLLSRLQSQADSATTELEQWILRAQWACAAARLGQIEAARAEITKLRIRNAAYAPTLTAWIFLAEGTADHFESLSTAAADRFKRAYSIAVAMGDAEIRSLAAAWIGASEFLMAQYEAACLHATEAIAHAPASCAQALTRAHLVLANCLNAVGETRLASTHYSRSRQFAVEGRDISMQSAILYNVAAFHIARISLEDAFGQQCGTELSTAVLELNSIDNLDNGIGLGSLRAMVPLLRAQLRLVERRWQEAEAIYSNSIIEAATHGQLRLAPRYLAEQAHCLAEMGEDERAISTASQAASQLIDRTDLDDRAACHARLSLCLSKLGRTREARINMQAALESRGTFTKFQSEHRERIASIAMGVA